MVMHLSNQCIADQWDQATDDEYMIYAVRTADPRNAETTRELQARLSSGHLTFVGDSDFYIVSMWDGSGACSHYSFDLRTY